MDWSIREHILTLAHRWYLALAAFLLGVLLGFGAAFLFPTPYRAEADLFVTYNGDAIYRNPDDYKNWQLKQLNDLALSETILQETLRRLQVLDPAWADVETADLRARFRTLWRNTGRWRLVVESPDPKQSELAAAVWSQVYLDTYARATGAAAETLALDGRLQGLSAAQADAQVRLESLQAAHGQLAAWGAGLDQLAGAGGVGELERWRGLAVFAAVAGYNPAWQSLGAAFPPGGAGPEPYRAWLEQVFAVMEAEMAVLQSQVNDLDVERGAALAEYQLATDASLGLSSTVEMGLLAPVAPAQPVRSTALAALVGGLLGIFSWVMLWLVRPVLPSRS